MIRYLSSTQLEKLLCAPDTSTLRGFRDRTLMELLFSTGLRVAEAVSIDRNQIDLKTREFTIVGKGHKQRVVFLSARASLWLGKYLNKRKDNLRPLFISWRNATSDSRMTTRSVQQIVDKYAKLAKLPIKVTPHMLRHTLATDLLTNGANLRVVQEILGHKHLSTTEIYTHVTNAQLKESYQKFHSGNFR